MKLRVPDYFDDFPVWRGRALIAAAWSGRLFWTRTPPGGTALSPARWGSGSAPRCSLTERTGAFRFAAGAAPF